MNWKEYEAEAMSTRLATASSLEYTTIALCGEAGEFANEVKKNLRGDYGTHNELVAPASREKLLLELGDVLWYLTSACQLLGSGLEEIAEKNLAKLRKRRSESTWGHG